MPSLSAARPNRRRVARPSRARRSGARPVTGSRWGRGWKQTFRGIPLFARAGMAFVLLLAAALAGNWIYQVYRKPSELLFPLSDALSKKPAETWSEYGPLFKRYSTPTITAGFLAALAQVEGAGNPVARTYWRFAWTAHPLQIYRPASSAVGMYQITDGTFAEANRYCVQDHRVVEAARWKDSNACWFRGIYSRVLPERVLPSRAIEITAAYLDHGVESILARRAGGHGTLQRRQALASVIHLCGAGAADEYAKRGFRLGAGQRCGDHEVRVYVAHIAALRTEFDRLDEL